MFLDIGYGRTSIVIKLPSGMCLAVCRKAIAIAAAVSRLIDKPLSFVQLYQCLYKHQLCRPCFLSLVIL